MELAEINKLVIVGNGFDLAHGLPTTYKNFLDWYLCKAFNKFNVTKHYIDALIEIEDMDTNIRYFSKEPETFDEVIKLVESRNTQTIRYKSTFFQRILELLSGNNWVDIERYYFQMLKSHFSNINLNDKKKTVSKLNIQFDLLIEELNNYMAIINYLIPSVKKLSSATSVSNLDKIFLPTAELKILNFNYTDTLNLLAYAKDEEIIHIHGRASDKHINPIIFGYGDESDPAYQNIEDSGENMYLEHIKSFGYFKTANYNNLLTYIDSAPFVAYIIGHSCGLSDRVLLNEVFEHSNCQKIDIFWHLKKDGSDNFKEITQEISRHFKPHNKNIMRRKIINKNPKNIIPQNINIT